MKTIELKVYEFEELSDSAKEKTRDWFRQGALDYEWWESTYEDAANVGLKITGFELDRERHATGEFNCLGQGAQCAGLILREHGKDCETFKTATQYLSDLANLEKQIADVDGDERAASVARRRRDLRPVPLLGRSAGARDGAVAGRAPGHGAVGDERIPAGR